MSKITVVAQVTVKQECAESAAQELLKLVAPTRQEEGCVEYLLHRDNEDPALFVFYETWESRAHLDRHMESAHFRSYVEAIGGMVVDKSVRIMTRIA